MLNIGIIGCGDVATHSYMPGLQAMADRANVVAVFDIFQNRVDDALGFFPNAAPYLDYDAFLGHGPEKMDLVFNLTPAPLHRDITAKALEAGYSVYSEKPIASTLGEAAELVALAEEKGLHFFCAPAMMVTGRFMWLKEFIYSGAIGNPYFIKGQIGGMGPASWRTYSGDPRVFYTPKVGPLVDLGVYQLHALTGLFGPARTVSAVGGIMNPTRKLLQPALFGEEIEVQAPDLYSINLTFDNNRNANLFNTFAMPATKSPMFEIYGSMGTVSIGQHQWFDGNGTTDIYVRDESEGGEAEGWNNDSPVPNPIEASDILGSGILHALDVMANGTDNVLTAAHAEHVLEIMLAAGESLKTGDSIEIASSF
ncbi:MAG: Gfo/Idh/MocA family oxidoreductase [Thermomicrobiales bacterium]|nr:Gfo/Idh/MocA family oxidoreductase [Thermomicrobiales bacterium]MCO5225369.1 Gfo/Idh/MocA family oxidoreductase [Thermomicrobiales bacterium]MCO5227283.1 Gfo/Idh/MocA family oxidoreductase [Thermomicrobiales bacterium]